MTDKTMIMDLARRAIQAQNSPSKQMVVTPWESVFLKTLTESEMGRTDWAAALFDIAALEGMPPSDGKSIQIVVK